MQSLYDSEHVANTYDVIRHYTSHIQVGLVMNTLRLSKLVKKVWLKFKLG